jgi:hypothetical protein
LARPYSFGPFYDYLMTLFPEHRSPQGVFDVPRLARDLGVSNETVYQWLRRNIVTIEGAKRLLRLSDGRAEPANFIRFLFESEFFPASQ